MSLSFCVMLAVGLRDHRIRAHFGDKFDNRDGVVDWDYQMRVKPAAGVIHSKLYREWRLTGVAYEFGDQKYDQPNRTMGSFAEVCRLNSSPYECSPPNVQL